jgi:glycosyltransferase involved in cell wall biosynthesis
MTFVGLPKVFVARQGFSTRLASVIAVERSRFDALRRNYGSSVAIGALMRRVGRSVAFRSARAIRRLHRIEDVLAFLPLSHRFMQDDVLFIGYLEAALGLGESMRGMVRSVAATGFPFALYPYRVGVETRRIGRFMADRYDRRGRHRINVIEMTADQVPAMFREVGRWRTMHSYNILRTYWELPKAPTEWAAMLEGIDEIWAPNEFVHHAFREIFDGPITIVPPCVDIKMEESFSRPQFGMEDDTFYFTFSFDYFSYPARKNPLGVVEAFRAAFPRGDENVGLVIKSTSATGQYREIKAAIQQAAQMDPRIKVIDRILSRNEMLSLIEQSDCYVSLHRSEGFGLGMAEAMAFGKPVIGTDYSGSTEFLSERTGFPVAYRMGPVRRGEYVYCDGQSWAEPDKDAAVEAMRRVFYDPAERERRATAGKAFVEEHYGRPKIGRIAAARLGDVLATVAPT